MISKIMISALLTLTNFLAFGQEFPKEKTKDHSQIKGTNIFIIPPTSFESSNRFKGFYNPYDPYSIIMVTEIPGPYQEVTKGFNSKTLNARGMKLKIKKNVRLGEFNGVLLELDQFANGIMLSKQILVYGNQKESTLINGTFRKDSLELGKKIKLSILSTVIDYELKNNPRLSLNYSINEKVGSLKFKAVMGNGMIFNRDLKIPTESSDRAALITAQSFSNIIIEDKKQFCISRLKQFPGSYSIVSDKKIKEIKIDSLSGFELFAQNNTKEMYLVILFEQNSGYYILSGTYLKESSKTISDIKRIIKTFKRKN